MRITTTLPTNDAGVTDISMARHLEDLGYDAVGVPDLILGTGSPGLDPALVLASVAGVTSRIGLEFGVLSLPLRPVAWVAAQVQTLQHLSSGRVTLGVGIGGFPGSPFWLAVGAPLHGRGRITDDALRVLPGLIRGEPTPLSAIVRGHLALDGKEDTSPTLGGVGDTSLAVGGVGDTSPALDGAGDTSLVLAPGAAVPPIFVGGNSEAAMRRAVLFGDGWAPSLISPAGLAVKAARLREIAASLGRPVPSISVGGHAFLSGERPAVESFVENLVRVHGMPPEEAAEIPVTGDISQVSERLAAYATAGASTISLALDGPNWPHQAELLATARPQTPH